jgi:hypothetical protein
MDSHYLVTSDRACQILDPRSPVSGFAPKVDKDILYHVYEQRSLTLNHTVK